MWIENEASLSPRYGYSSGSQSSGSYGNESGYGGSSYGGMGTGYGGGMVVGKWEEELGEEGEGWEAGWG